MKVVAIEKADQNRAAVDPWSVVHFSTGLAMGLMDVPFAASMGVALGYEIVEQYVERREWGQEFFETSGPETTPNALLDLAVFAAGHWLGTRWNRTG